MATSLERMEDDVQAMIDGMVKEALSRLDHQIVLIDDRAKLLERIEKIEQFITNLGPLAKLSERLAECERLLTCWSLDTEKNEANVEALISETKLISKRIEGLENFAEQQALKNAEIVAQRDTLDEQAEMLLYLEGRIDTIRNHIAEPPAETAAMALYGGEQ
ncbi:MAG: hypothetical protein ACHWZW_12010 [Spirulina sp.]